MIDTFCQRAAFPAGRHHYGYHLAATNGTTDETPPPWWKRRCIAPQLTIALPGKYTATPVAPKKALTAVIGRATWQPSPHHLPRGSQQEIPHNPLPLKRTSSPLLQLQAPISIGGTIDIVSLDTTCHPHPRRPGAVYGRRTTMP